MKRLPLVSLLIVLVLAVSAEAARVRRVVVRGPRRTVVVHTGFPVHRVLPAVVVRPGPVVRVAPRLYLAPVVFGAMVVALPAATGWRGSESLDRDDGWTDFTMNIDKRGREPRSPRGREGLRRRLVFGHQLDPPTAWPRRETLVSVATPPGGSPSMEKMAATTRRRAPGRPAGPRPPPQAVRARFPPCNATPPGTRGPGPPSQNV